MGSTDKHTRGLGVLTKTCAQGNVFALQVIFLAYGDQGKIAKNISWLGS